MNCYLNLKTNILIALVVCFGMPVTLPAITISGTTPASLRFEVTNAPGTFSLLDTFFQLTTGTAQHPSLDMGNTAVDVALSYNIDLASGAGSLTTRTIDNAIVFVAAGGAGAFSVQPVSGPDGALFEVLAMNLPVTALESPSGTARSLTGNFPSVLNMAALGFGTDPRVDQLAAVYWQWYTMPGGATMHYKYPVLITTPEPGALFLLAAGTIATVAFRLSRRKE